MGWFRKKPGCVFEGMSETQLENTVAEANERLLRMREDRDKTTLVQLSVATQGKEINVTFETTLGSLRDLETAFNGYSTCGLSLKMIGEKG